MESLLKSNSFLNLFLFIILLTFSNYALSCNPNSLASVGCSQSANLNTYSEYIDMGSLAEMIIESRSTCRSELDTIINQHTSDEGKLNAVDLSIRHRDLGLIKVKRKISINNSDTIDLGEYSFIEIPSDNLFISLSMQFVNLQIKKAQHAVSEYYRILFNHGVHMDSQFEERKHNSDYPFRRWLILGDVLNAPNVSFMDIINSVTLNLEGKNQIDSKSIEGFQVAISKNKSFNLTRDLEKDFTNIFKELGIIGDNESLDGLNLISLFCSESF